MRANNTRYQVLPFYNSKKNWFLYDHGYDFGAHILISSGRVPAFQFISTAGSPNNSFDVFKIDNINDPLGSSTFVDSITADVDTYDFYKNGVDVDVCSFNATGNIVNMDLEGWYYLVSDLDGSFSEPFKVGCVTLQRYKLEWSNTCDNNIASYINGWINELWFDDDLVFNVPEPEEEIEKDSSGKVIAHTVIKRYSFTNIIPEYLLDCLYALNSHDTITLTDNETITTINIHDIQIENESGNKEEFNTVTVSYRIVGEVSPDNLGCCTDIDFIDETVDPVDPSENCPGFGVTINESAGDLTYALASEPTEGSLVVSWTKDGATIGSGSTVSLGGYGTYKVTVRKNGCTVTDSYSYLDPCELFFLEVTQNDGVITANTVGAPDTVTFEVFDATSSSVATSLPYTAVTDGNHTVVASSGSCERQETININLSDPCAHTADIVRNGTQLTGSSDDGSATHNWELDQGNGYGASLGTSSVLNISNNGLYRYTAIVDGCEKYATLVVVDLGISVEVTNITDISNASGSIQIIENTTGYTFDFNYDDSRYLLFRNGDQMTYREGVAAGSLDVNEYDVVSGQLITSSVFPMTVDDIIEIKPV